MFAALGGSVRRCPPGVNPVSHLRRDAHWTAGAVLAHGPGLMIRKLRAIWALIGMGFAEMDRLNLGLLSAGVAFFGLMSIFPGIAALIAVFGLLADPHVVSGQLELLDGVIPDAAYALFHAQIETLLSAGRPQLTSATAVSLLLTLWSTRAGVAALMRGLNAIYGTRNRGGVHHATTALVLTVSLMTVAVLALMAVVVTPVAMAAVNNVVPLRGSTTAMLETVRWALALAVMVGGLGLLYRFGPNRKGNRPGWLTPGAVAVVIVWLGASALFSAYISNVERLAEVYGSIGAVIALMLWLYLSAFLIMLGGVFNRELERRKKRKQRASAAAAMS